MSSGFDDIVRNPSRGLVPRRGGGSFGTHPFRHGPPRVEAVLMPTGLEDVRIHDLRHSFASRALALGESLTMIGKLLGHTQVQTTARYAHLARDSIQTAAARVTGSIGGNLFVEPAKDMSRSTD